MIQGSWTTIIKLREKLEVIELDLCLVVPALSADRIAVHVRGGDAWPGAVADLTAHHWVAAKRQRLTLGALRLQSPRRADAVASHRFT